MNRTTSDFDQYDNPFYRTFVNDIPLTAQALPDMLGSVAVRDMREAA